MDIMMNRKADIFHMGIVLWMFFVCSICDAHKYYNVTLNIEPEWIRRGQSVRLYCNYDLGGDPLYSVKWYRGHLEFYRYSPSENPPGKIFLFPDIKVDLTASNDTQVTLRNVGFKLSGNFSCEVTADAPSFHTSFATNALSVVGHQITTTALVAANTITIPCAIPVTLGLNPVANPNATSDQPIQLSMVMMATTTSPRHRHMNCLPKAPAGKTIVNSRRMPPPCLFVALSILI